MSLFANYRADRLIAEVKSSGNPGSPLAQKALEKLVALGPSAIEPIVDALKNDPPSALLDALSKPDMPKQAILDVIGAQKARFTVRELLNAAYAQEPSERTGLFKIIAEIADESSIDDLVARIEGKDPVARLHIINVLARFNTPKVQEAVQKQLKDRRN